VFQDLFGLNAVRLGSLHKHVEEDFDYFLGDEREGPGEDVHVIGQHERVLSVVVLLYLDLIVLKAKDGRLVVVDVAVVGRREDRDD
jgi:hypothetical protein